MATATIQVAYEAETSSLKATVNEINQINDKVVEGAQDSAKKVKGFFGSIASSFSAAFSSGEVKKALDNQTKAIDNLGKSGKSLTGQLRQMKQELSGLEQAGQDGTDAFNKLLVAASKLEDQIGDTRAKVKILASDTFKFDAALGAVQGLAAGFQVAQGAAALFGAENEDLNKAIVKITAATAVATGIEQIAKLVKEESAVKTGVLTLATAAYNVVVGTSTGLMKAFRIALAATGVGALIVGLVALVENFDKLKDAINGTSDRSRALDSTLGATKAALGGAIEETTKVGNAFELAKQGVISKDEALQVYNDTLGNTFGKTNDLNVAEANYVNKKDAYIKATIARAQAQALLAESAQLSAEAATAKQEDVRNVGEKLAAFFLRANAAQVKFYSAGIIDVTSYVQKINNKVAEGAQNRVSSEKNALAETRLNLFKEKTKEAEIIEASAGIIDENQQKVNETRATKRKAANDKAIDEAKKAAEDQAKAREQLLKLEQDALVASLDAQSKILNENNNKVIELEKTFVEARFKAGSEEEIKAREQLATAIAAIRTQEATQLAEIEKAANEKLLKEKLDIAKAAEGATLQQQLTALETQQAIELSFAKSLGLKETDIATRYATQIAKIKTDIAAATIETQINELKTLEIEEGSSLERRVQLINIEADKRRQTAKDTIKDEKQLASELELINAETQQAITEENKTEFDKRIALTEQYAQGVLTAFKTFNDLSKAASENRIADIEATKSKELQAIDDSTMLERDKQKARVDANKKASIAIANEKRKQAVADRALAIFDIGINTAVAISKAVAASPLTGGLPFSALAALIGAAQIAAVLAKPIPKFERGGLIGGKLHSQGGTLIEAEQGEYMVNRRQSSKHRRELDAMNTSTEAFRKMIDEKYVRPALMSYSAGRRGKDGITVNASLNSKSMEKKLDTINKSLKNRNVVVNINQQDSRYQWQ